MKKNFRLLPLTALALLCWHPGASPAVKDAADLGNAATVTAFDGHNHFYTGGVVADVAKSVTRVDLVRTAGASVPTFEPLAPDLTCVVNGAAPAASTLKGKDVTKLAVMHDANKSLAVAIPAGVDVGTAKKMIALVTDTKAGNKIYTNETDGIKDAAVPGAALGDAKVVGAVAASKDTIFVAVGKANDAGGFGKADSGFVRLKQNPADGNKLGVVNNRGTFGSDSAYKFDVTAHVVAGDYVPSTNSVKFMAGQAAVDQNSPVDMHWDDALERLYVGLGDVAVNADQGGVVGLLVGEQTPNNQLVMQPALDLKQAVGGALFGAGVNNTQAIIGGYRHDAVAGVYVRKVRTMHTSTGKSYAIVNGGSALAADKTKVKAWVHAIPLTDGSGDAKGFVAKKDDFGHKVAVDAEMTKVDRTQLLTGVGFTAAMKAATVGYHPSYVAHVLDTGTPVADEFLGVQDMQVVGDTVYASFKGAGGAVGNSGAAVTGEEKGIFASTALFNENGAIRGWTPWQRAVGQVADVEHFGVDEKTGSTWYLDATNKKSLVTQWNKGDNAVVRAGDTALSKVLDANFGDKGGVLGMFSFDAETPGFATSHTDAIHPIPAQSYDIFSMAVATGNGRVALIEAGTGDGVAANFVPTDNYKNTVVAGAKRVGTDGDTVYVYDDTSISGKALANLGPITCAEVARIPSTANATGWLFVGGENGIAVLRDPADGKGWPTAALNTGLGKLKADLKTGAMFPGMGPDAGPGGNNEAYFRFAQIAKTDADVDLGIKNVRKLMADGSFLYILTKTGLQRLDISTAAKFNAVSADVTLNANNALEKTVLKLADADDLKPIATNTTVESTTADDHVLDANDEFYDMMLVRGKNAGVADTTSILVATSKGLFVREGLKDDMDTNPERGWKRPIGTDGANSFVCGPALKLNFIDQKRGGSWAANPLAGDNKAEGNLYVTALDKDQKNVNVYRFNVSDGAVKQIREPYKDDSGNPVDYFYRVGKIEDVAGMEWNGNLDMQAQARHYGETGVAGDFVDRVAMGPESSAFLKAGQAGSAIDLGLNLDKSFHPSMICKDAASGSVYVVTNKGVRVNE